MEKYIYIYKLCSFSNLQGPKEVCLDYLEHSGKHQKKAIDLQFRCYHKLKLNVKEYSPQPIN